MKILDLGRTFGMGAAHIFGPGQEVLPFPYKFTDSDEKVSENLNKVIPQANLMILGGGADIWTGFYGQNPVATNAGEKSHRDRTEELAWRLAQAYRVPTLGICRGAQFICAATGGTLIQHVDGHIGDHEVELSEETDDPHHGVTRLVTNSVHHQMMVPPRDGRTHVLGWTENRSREYVFDIESKPNLEVPLINPEVVYFGNHKALGVQWHPEFYHDTRIPAAAIVARIATRYLNLKRVTHS